MINRLKKDLIIAMKEKNQVQKSTLQLAIASFNNFMKENKALAMTSEQEITLIQRELKQINESLEFAKKSGREDMVNDELEKVQLLMRYLPEQLTEDEIRDVIIESLSELNIVTPFKNDRGKIMKVIMPKLKGKSNGKTIDNILSNMLK